MQQFNVVLKPIFLKNLTQPYSWANNARSSDDRKMSWTRNPRTSTFHKPFQ